MTDEFGEGAFSQFPAVNGYYIPEDCDHIPEIMASWFASANGYDQERFLAGVENDTRKWSPPAMFQWATLKLSGPVKEMLIDMAHHAQTDGENHE